MRCLYRRDLMNGCSTTFNDKSIDSHAYDNIGNVTKYIDESGNVVAEYTYDAFGRIISQTGPMTEVFLIRFSSKYYDSETGLYYYGYRFYAPALMRWLNRDPIEESGGLNLYGFCSDNPICNIDSYGLTVIVHMNPTPSRQDNIKNKAGQILNVRGMTRVLGNVKFSCNKCILRAKGIIQLWIELLNENDKRWGTRFKRYAQRNSAREDANTLAHEMDHFNTWKAFLEFVKTANSIDGKYFGLSGCEDYSLWMRSVGVIKFHTPIGIFNEAEFFSRQEHPEWAPTHCRILMHSTLDGSQSFSNVVSSIKSVEDIFQKTAKFKGKMFVRNESLAGYFSVCTNIDNCGWTATFTVQRDHNHFNSAQSWRASAELQKDLLITNACDEVLDALLQYPGDDKQP